MRDFTFGLMPELIKRYRVIAIDRPGLGYSEDHPESADIVVQARLMQATAAALGAEASHRAGPKLWRCDRAGLGGEFP